MIKRISGSVGLMLLSILCFSQSILTPGQLDSARYYTGGHGGWTTFYAPTWTLPTYTPGGDSTISTTSTLPTGFSIYNWLMQYEGDTTITQSNVDYSGTQILINVGGGGFYSAPSPPWNNLQGTPTNNKVFSNLIDSSGVTTTVGLKLSGQSWSNNNSGKQTGTNTGVYPDYVLISNYYSSNAVLDTIQITGLSNNTFYHLNLMSSLTSSNAGIVTFNANGKSTSVNSLQNSSLSSLDSVESNSSGIIYLTFHSDSSSFAPINALAIYKYNTTSSFPPNVNAGIDQTLSHGTTVDTLIGTASGNNGNVITQQTWSQILGTNVNIVNPDSLKTAITGLSDGNTYQFKLSVTDNKGLSNADTVTIHVLSNTIVDTFLYANGDTLISGKLNAVKMRTQSYAGTNGYIYLPKGYDSTQNKRYALIDFYHGAGGNGAASNALSDQGLLNMINNGTIPYSSTVPGDTTWFIVYSVAGDYMGTTGSYAQIQIDYRFLLDYYRLKIDTSRVYATGLSAGGNQTLIALSEYPQIFASGVPMSTVWSNLSAWDLNFLDNMAPGWIWQIHGYTDNTAIFSLAYNAINNYNTIRTNHKALLATFNGAHCCWETYYAPTWKWTSNNSNDVGTYNNMTIYDWMLSHVRTVLSKPTINAGTNQTLNPGTTTTTLNATASTSNGSIKQYQWDQISGNSTTINSPSNASTTVTGLTNGNTYMFKLSVIDDSSQVSFDTLSVTVDSVIAPTDTVDYKISLNPNAVFYNGDTAFFQLYDLNVTGYCSALIDEQTADPLHGIITPIPSTVFQNGYSSRAQYPSIAVIDLGGLYKVTNIYTYNNYGTDELYVQYGVPNNWSVDTIKISSGNNGWIDTKDTIYTRFLRIKWAGTGYDKINELMLYGHLIGDSLSRTPPSKPIMQYADGNTMSKFMGSNIAGIIPDTLLHGSIMNTRSYTNVAYLDTGHVHNIDSASFVFSKFSSYNSNSNYYIPQSPVSPLGPLHHYSGSGSDSGMMAGDVRGSGYADLNATQGVNQMGVDSGWNRAIDYTLHPNADSSLSGVYDRISRMAWNMGAAFGKNVYPTDSLQYTMPSVGSGLNLMDYIETGNENDGGWLSPTIWYSPAAWEAYNSAYYDGNNKRLGSRMGIKNADSTIQVVMGGDAFGTFDYMKSLFYFSYYDRTNHTIPFDIYNFHSYSYLTGIPASAASPENHWDADNIGNIRLMWQQRVDTSKIWCPQCDVWETEWGYDRNGSLTNAVQRVPNQDSAQVQANWVARSWIMESFVKGLAKSFYYMFTNANWKDYDSAAFNNYSTCGLVDGYYQGSIYNDGTYSFNYYAFPAYYYTRTIYQTLFNYKPDSIIYENGLGDSLYCYRYVNVNNTDSVAYVIWSGTMSNKNTNGYNVNLGHNNTTVSLVKLNDKMMNGITYTPQTNINGQINLTINETPQIILTTSGVNGGQLVSNNSPTPPIANAGTNQYLPSSDTMSTLTGTAIAQGGASIMNYHWHQIKGKTLYVINPTTDTTQIKGLTPNNSYTFQLTATDNNGLSDTSTVLLSTIPVIVHPSISIPTSIKQYNTNNDTIYLPTPTITQGTYPIENVVWAQISGPSSTNITTLNNVWSAKASNAIPGNYVFKATVSDTSGYQMSDTMTVNFIQYQRPIVSFVQTLPDTTYVIDSMTNVIEAKIDSSSFTHGNTYTWTARSNYAVTFSQPDSLQTQITIKNATVAGDAIVEFVMIDSLGMQSNVLYDTIQFVNTVVANAGNDQILPYNATSTTLDGTKTVGYKIQSYHWTAVASYPNVTIVNPTQAMTQINGLQSGNVYYFNLNVTDLSGIQSNDVVKITVNSISTQPLKFKYIQYVGTMVYLIFEDTTNGKLYSIKLQDQ